MLIFGRETATLKKVTEKNLVVFASAKFSASFYSGFLAGFSKKIALS